jgi:hypothetical protein
VAVEEQGGGLEAALAEENGDRQIVEAIYPVLYKGVTIYLPAW